MSTCASAPTLALSGSYSCLSLRELRPKQRIAPQSPGRHLSRASPHAVRLASHVPLPAACSARHCLSILAHAPCVQTSENGGFAGSLMMAALASVGGHFYIKARLAPSSAQHPPVWHAAPASWCELPLLLRVRGAVQNNGKLTAVTMPALASVGGYVDIAARLAP